MPDTDRDLLTPEEAADVLGVTRQRVHSLMTTGRLDSVPADTRRGRRITRAALQDFAERRRTEAANRLAEAERREAIAADRLAQQHQRNTAAERFRASAAARLAALDATAEAIR